MCDLGNVQDLTSWYSVQGLLGRGGCALGVGDDYDFLPEGETNRVRKRDTDKDLDRQIERHGETGNYEEIKKDSKCHETYTKADDDNSKAADSQSARQAD